MYPPTPDAFKHVVRNMLASGQMNAKGEAMARELLATSDDALLARWRDECEAQHAEVKP